jgi:hypothetical protein
MFLFYKDYYYICYMKNKKENTKAYRITLDEYYEEQIKRENYELAVDHSISEIRIVFD